MKLKNKKTGEIIEFALFDGNELQGGVTLEILTKEWEDYHEEPKDFWFIDPEILIACESTDPLLCDKKVAIETMKQIGNYFDSREEAEKAVEKLKAWKRLKDKGFGFLGVKGLDYAINFEVNPPYTHITFDEYTATEEQKEFYNDLMLLFGGEE